MAKVSASASIGAKLKFPNWDKRFDAFENVNPHASISIEKEVDSNDEEALLAEAGSLYQRCRKYVEEQINEDIKSSKNKSK